MKIIKQKDVWELIIKMHNDWSTPSYYNHVRESIKLIEKENNIKIPIEVVWKLDKRYKKMRDEKSL